MAVQLKLSSCAAINTEFCSDLRHPTSEGLRKLFLYPAHKRKKKLNKWVLVNFLDASEGGFFGICMLKLL